ncbi:MAG: histidine phosphatase family protein, partial [Planctomycetes bacterium]|nr:histidine phosphatase family protein [Planctomycetota bacterium]
STVHHPPDAAGGQPAELFARAAGAKAKPVDELADPDLGLLEGLLRQDFAERYPKRYRQWQDDPLTLSPPEGEEIAEARARIFAALARVLRRSRSEEVAVVLHSLGLGLLRSWLADRPAGDLWTMLRGRDRVERYALTGEMIEWLEDATRVEYSGS